MIVAILILLLLIIFIIIFIPPFHWLIILSLVSLMSCLFFLFARLFIRSLKYCLFVSLIFFSLLCLMALKAVEPVTVILLIIFFSLIFILIK